MKLKKLNIVLFTLCFIMFLTFHVVIGAERKLTYPLKVNPNGTTASLETKCTYVDSGSIRWKDYSFYNYNVTNSNSYAFAMIPSETKWIQSGSDSKGYHTNTFVWSYKTYIRGDAAQKPVTKATKKIQYKYTISDNGYRASLVN